MSPEHYVQVQQKALLILQTETRGAPVFLLKNVMRALSHGWAIERRLFESRGLLAFMGERSLLASEGVASMLGGFFKKHLFESVERFRLYHSMLQRYQVMTRYFPEAGRGGLAHIAPVFYRVLEGFSHYAHYALRLYQLVHCRFLTTNVMQAQDILRRIPDNMNLFGLFCVERAGSVHSDKNELMPLLLWSYGVPMEAGVTLTEEQRGVMGLFCAVVEKWRQIAVFPMPATQRLYVKTTFLPPGAGV